MGDLCKRNMNGSNLDPTEAARAEVKSMLETAPDDALEELIAEDIFAGMLKKYPQEAIDKLAHDPETVKKLLNYERPYPLSDEAFTKLFENMQTAPTAKALIDGVLEASNEKVGIADIIEMSTQYPLNGVTVESRAA